MPTPSASVKTWVRPTLEMKAAIRRKKPAGSRENPNNRPSCPLMMLSAIPFRYPVRMGRARKFVRKPRAARLPPRYRRRPVTIASVMVSDTYRPGSWAASGATVAATIAHVAASGAMISCRDDPRRA